MRGTAKHVAIALGLVLGACVDDVRPGDGIADEVDELEIDESVEAPASSYTDDVGPGWVLYPSTYSSNCTCSFCTAYCVVNGTTVKAGACC